MQSEYETAKREYDEAKKTYEEDLKKYEADSKQYEADNEAYQQYLKDKEAYDKAYADYLKALEQYEADSKQYETDNEAYQQYLKDKAAYDKAYADYLTALEQYKKDKTAYDEYVAAKEAYDAAKADYDTAHAQWVIEAGIYEDVVDYNKIVDTNNADIAAKNDALKDSIVSGTVEDASENDQAIKDNVHTTAAVSEGVKNALAKYSVLQAKKAVLVALKSEIESYSGKIGDDDYDDYLNKVKEYNALVDSYNAEIKAYNDAVDAYNKAVDEYNSTKDTTDIGTGGTETGTADWGNIKSYSQLSHIDVKYSAASTKTAEIITNEDGSTSTKYTDTITGYTVTGVYPTSDAGRFGVQYTSNGTQGTLYLNKRGDEFSSSNHGLRFNGNSDTVSFYMTVVDSENKTTGLVVKLDPTSVYPEGTYYSGSNADKLARYKDSKGNSIPMVDLDGDGKKESYDISGMSVFVVSTMTCDAFRWNRTNNNGYEGKTDGLDLVLSLQTLIDIHKNASEKTLAFLSYEGQLKANATLTDKPTAPVAPEEVKEPTAPSEPTAPEEVKEPTAPTAPTFDQKEPGEVEKPTAPTAPTFDQKEPGEVEKPTAPIKPVFDKTEPTAPTMLGMLDSVSRLDQLTKYEETTVVIPDEEDPTEEPEEEAEDEPSDDALPQTGQNWAAAALLALGGMFVTAAGWIRRKTEDNA